MKAPDHKGCHMSFQNSVLTKAKASHAIAKDMQFGDGQNSSNSGVHRGKIVKGPYGVGGVRNHWDKSAVKLFKHQENFSHPHTLVCTALKGTPDCETVGSAKAEDEWTVPLLPGV